MGYVGSNPTLSARKKIRQSRRATFCPAGFFVFQPVGSGVFSLFRAGCERSAVPGVGVLGRLPVMRSKVLIKGPDTDTMGWAQCAHSFPVVNDGQVPESLSPHSEIREFGKPLLHGFLLGGDYGRKR